MKERQLPSCQEHLQVHVLRQHMIEISMNRNFPSVSIIGVIQLVTVRGFLEELTLKSKYLIQY